MPDRHEFHRVEICGRIFTGSISAEGPCLKMLENRTYGRGVPLGVALSIAKSTGRTYYAICKYNEPHILLPRFSDEDVEIVAREFGIPISGRIRPRSFTESPAWIALRKWAKEHPRHCPGVLPYGQLRPGVVQHGLQGKQRRLATTRLEANDILRPATRKARHSARPARQVPHAYRQLRPCHQREREYGQPCARWRKRWEMRMAVLPSLSSLKRRNTSNSERASSAAVGSSRISTSASRI